MPSSMSWTSSSAGAARTSNSERGCRTRDIDMPAVRATLEDLMRVEGKAELIGGRVVELMPSGRKHNKVAARIYKSLDQYAERTGRGEAYTDNMGYAVPELESGRETFSPDASYYVGPFPDDAAHRRAADVRRRSAQSERLRRSGRGRGEREARRLLRGRHPGRVGCQSAGRDRDVLSVHRPGKRRRRSRRTPRPTRSRPCPAGGSPSRRCSFDIRDSTTGTDYADRISIA